MAQVNKIFSNNSQYQLELIFAQKSQSITNNTSQVSRVLRIRKLSGSGYWASGTFPWSINVGGQSTSGSISSYDFRNYTVLTLIDDEVTITHDSDGSKEISASGSFTGASSLGSANASGSLTLTTIPRASSFTLGGSTQTGSAVTATITRASTSFTHRVRWRIGSGSWTTVVSNATTSASFTVPHTAIPNATSATITVAVQTYSGTTAIGSEQTSTRSLSVPSSVVPSFTTITHSEYVSSVATEIGEYVQHKSRLNVAITGASGDGGSTISSYKITIDGQVANAQSGVTEVINSSGNLNLVGTVTDSRGRSTSKTVVVPVLPYQIPSLSSYDLNRSDADGTLNIIGTYARLRLTARVSSLNSKNTATYKVESKTLGGSYTVKTDTSPIGITETKENVYSGYSVTQEHQLKVTISDKLHTTVIETDTLYLATGGMNFAVGHGGVASAFGKIPTHGSTYSLEIGDKGIISDGGYFKEDGMSIFSGTLITWDSTDRIWHSKPSGVYYVDSDGESQGYPTNYMSIYHTTYTGNLMNQIGIGATGNVWTRRMNDSQSMDWSERIQPVEDPVDKIRNVDILTNEKIIYGHRGCGYAPENTKAAISVGRSYGLKGFEIDVQPTLDNVWVCHHDLTVDRVTNGTGAVSGMTYTQFKNLDVTGGYFQSLFEGVKTMSLVEAISEVSQGDGNLYLDIKATPTRAQLADLIEIIKSANMLRKTIFSAFNTNTRTMLRELSHEIVLGYSVYNMSYADIDNAAALDNCLIDFDVNSTTDVENKVKYALSKNVPVFAWTVNEYESETDVKSMRYLTKLGISGMTSDNFFGMKMTKTSRHITVRKVGSNPNPLISTTESTDLLYNRQFAVKDNGYYIRLHVPFYPKKSDQYKMNAENSESLGDGIIKPFITVYTWFQNRAHNLDREMYVEQVTVTGENYGTGQSAFETSCILKCRSLTTGDIIPPSEWERFYAYITFDGWQLRDQ